MSIQTAEQYNQPPVRHLTEQDTAMPLADNTGRVLAAQLLESAQPGMAPKPAEVEAVGYHLQGGAREIAAPYGPDAIGHAKEEVSRFLGSTAEQVRDGAFVERLVADYEGLRLQGAVYDPNARTAEQQVADLSESQGDIPFVTVFNAMEEWKNANGRAENLDKVRVGIRAVGSKAVKTTTRVVNIAKNNPELTKTVAGATIEGVKDYNQMRRRGYTPGAAGFRATAGAIKRGYVTHNSKKQKSGSPPHRRALGR